MKAALTLFKIRNIDISIHWSFPFIIVWTLLIMTIQQATVSQTLWAMLGISLVFICIVLHELGHALMAAHYGIKTKSITLLPIGGMANMQHMPEKPVQEIMISLAGPMMNIVLALLLLPFIKDYVPFWQFMDTFSYLDNSNMLLYIHTINVLLAIFNLIPAFPMDGGRVLRGIIAAYTSYGRATAIAAFIGRSIAIIFIIGGLLNFNLLLAVIGLFIVLSGRAEETLTFLRHHARGLLIGEIMTTDVLAFPSDLPLQTAARKIIHSPCSFFAIVYHGGAPAIASRTMLFQAMAGHPKDNTLNSITRTNKNILQAETPVDEVIDQLTADPEQAFPVMTGEQICGIVSLNNLSEHSLVFEEMEAGNSSQGRVPLVTLIILLLSTWMAAAQAQPDSSRNHQIWQHLLNGRPSDHWVAASSTPLPGALLPYKRIVAYYGNFYSSQMGILGALPPDSMLSRLKQEVTAWQLADPVLPVQPALHYIAVTAQKTGGADGKYRARMPDAQIDKAIELAARLNAIVILDIQVGLSSLEDEIPRLDKYLRLPQVHLGIDPEYSMKNLQVPCTCIGTYDANDINFAINHLAALVKNYQLPPKILVVHRFTRQMVTNYQDITLMPQVQVVMNMDGFGGPSLKRDSYNAYISREPVEFTGFKLFYKNDVNVGKHLMGPAEVLQLIPAPIYIQYQ
ncbi:Zn-dependent protease (includes SpoIVFB) [Chitinophaga jiangningensis]|uniref:Zn-dependent protease (Includes SpoIVFB) n=1 Tax=Chitinophaga jiangningensis TaxID=1419482 RepID=A0A1M7C2K9_9BACT|nr:site-2 protease family protein [Chitinophaga jiangningensis]SHL61518.1 Zn-dependent protease (includes SpoIVFB) [Chitinophaga jiangningensis]